MFDVKLVDRCKCPWREITDYNVESKTHHTIQERDREISGNKQQQP